MDGKGPVSASIRWYNRLAAWIYPHVTDPLMTLALPVWNAEAEADFRDWEEEQGSGYDRALDEAYRAGAEQGYREGCADAEEPW